MKVDFLTKEAYTNPTSDVCYDFGVTMEISFFHNVTHIKTKSKDTLSHSNNARLYNNG